MRLSLTISRYLIGAILPYFVFSWLLLSVILFVQQAARFADIFFSANIPTVLVSQLTLALIPNVIAFTCPMAVLVGVIIGLSKMQTDSELVAIRASGVGNLQITIPILFIGILLSIFAFIINLYGVPIAARIVRQVAIQTAIYKLESPIEPGVFNTEVAGYTIYVRDGDIAAGQWKNIFVHNEDEKTGTVNLITSRKGRIDSSEELSELVLENAVKTTFNNSPGQHKFVSENIGNIRFAIQTRRGDLIQKLSSAELAPEELGLSELSEYASGREGAERTEAQILRQRRIVLSVTPLIFCLLGTALILRFSRRGKGFGVIVALGCLIVYYLLAFLGEQLARTGKISVFEGSLFPIILSFFVILWFNFSARLSAGNRVVPRVRETLSWVDLRPFRRRVPNPFTGVTTGIRDFDLVVSLIKFYFLTLCFLAAVFIIFTAFELWRFAGTFDGGIALLVRYLFYLVPFIYIQLAPSAAMVAVLTTYVLKSRQNEIVTWTSAGQSVYRLLLPCLLLMILIGSLNWLIQERVAPAANQHQDEFRTQIRNRGNPAKRPGRFWVANDKRIYSFQFDTDRNTTGNSNVVASDNDKQYAVRCVAVCAVRDLVIYEFADSGNLQTLYRSKFANWHDGAIVFDGMVEKSVLSEQGITTTEAPDGEVVEPANPFAELRKKPSHLNVSETVAQLENSEAEVEKRALGIALEKKYTTLFLPFVIALFTAPFALSLSRKGKVITVGYAVGLWLLFMGLTSAFEQFGLNGSLPPGFAVWAPLIGFSMLGIFLLSKVRT
ncbi:MAG TPA: LptF/LptG family permease [Pyrinomonadaceae bacterium]|nr:LptF/LptG family permease [Pyrinomonadaceae bacterium]